MKKMTHKKSLIYLNIFINLFLINHYCFSQIHSNKEYKSLIDSAHIAIVNKQDSIALQYYEKAFSLNPVKRHLELYEAASVCARLQLPDRCFMFLNMAIDKGMPYYENFKNNKHYFALKDDPRYEKCLNSLKINDSLFMTVNLQLEKIYNADQNIRKYYLNRLKEGMDENSEEAKQILEIMNIIDSNNLLEVEKIVDKHGILSNRLKTTKAKEAIPTIYLHATEEAQKSILKKMEVAVNEGEVNASNYAYLEDRIMVKNSGLQKYGTQYTIENNDIILYPLIEPEKVNLYREEVGLDTIEKYLEYVKERFNR